MPRKRRLQGIAALSAVTLATAGFTGLTTAADECADVACADDQDNPTDLLQTFGGDGIPEDALLKLEAFMKVEFDGSSPEQAFAQLTELYEQLGMADLPDAFMKLEGGILDSEEAFAKLEDAFIKLERIEGLEGLIPEDVLVEMQDAMPLIEEALLKMDDSGEIDPAMLKVFLDMIPEDE